MNFDVHTLKNLEKAIDKQFGSKEAHIYYSEELAPTLPESNSLIKKELPDFAILFPRNSTNTFKFYRGSSQKYDFSDNYDSNEIISLMKISVIQNPKYFPNNHLSIFVSKPEHLAYVDTVKKRFFSVKEYQDTDGY